MGTLAEIRDRVEEMLMDDANAIFTTDVIDEALRQCLDEYSRAWPLGLESVITLPGDGREIALNNLTGLTEVTAIWWPYDSDAASETWPPNKVRGWRLWWDDAAPVLILDIVDGSQPQTDDEMRVWYVKPHTIQDLDSADSTTVFNEHETSLVVGTAGKASLSRGLDLVETANVDLYGIALLGTFGKRWIREWEKIPGCASSSWCAVWSDLGRGVEVG